MAMVRRSDPVPAPPPLIADEGLSFTVPVIFRIKEQGAEVRSAFQARSDSAAARSRS